MGHWATWSAGRWPWNWVNFEVSSKLDWCVILWSLTLQRPTEEQARTSQQQQRCDEHQDENRNWETYSWLWLGLSSPSLEVHCAFWQTRFNKINLVTFILEQFQISINNIHRGRIRAGEDGLFGNCNQIQGVCSGRSRTCNTLTIDSSWGDSLDSQTPVASSPTENFTCHRHLLPFIRDFIGPKKSIEEAL